MITSVLPPPEPPLTAAVWRPVPVVIVLPPVAPPRNYCPFAIATVSPPTEAVTTALAANVSAVNVTPEEPEISTEVAAPAVRVMVSPVVSAVTMFTVVAAASLIVPPVTVFKVNVSE